MGFLHHDFTPGRRPRGRGGELLSLGTADPESPAAEYRVANWPALPPHRHWREITQGRDVPAEWAGREPLYPWEAKVYAMVP